MSDYQLGKKVPPPPPLAKPDVIERISGDVYTRNGKYETRDMAPKPVPVPDVYIYGDGAHWDALFKGLRRQQDDGFPIHEFGVL